MTESMIEKLARIISPTAFMPMSVHVSRASRQIDIDEAMATARAVLLALREPSEGMVEAGADASGNADDGEPILLLKNEARAGFTAAIDHILNESGEGK